MPRTRQDLQVEKGKPRTTADVQALLGPEPLLEDEDQSAYQALRDHVRAAVAPKDAIEEFWVRDVVDILWETLRLRRLKVLIADAARHDGVTEVLYELSRKYPNLLELVSLDRKDPEAREKVRTVLRQAGYDESVMTARALVGQIDTLERLERLIAQTEARRNNVLREVERRRESVAQRLRDAAAVIEDGEFREIEPAEERSEP